MRNIIPLFALVLAPTLQAQQPNPNCNLATPIAGSGSFSFLTTVGGISSFCGACCYDGSTGFWEWTAAAPGDYLLDVKWPNPLEEGDLTLAVFQPDSCSFLGGSAFIDCNAWIAAYGGIQLQNVQAGDRYLIQVSMFGFSDYQAMLHITEPPCDPGNYTDDVFEPNNSIAAATALSHGTYTGLFAHALDPDYFAVLIPAGEEVFVKVLNSEFRPDITVFDTGGSQITEQQPDWQGFINAAPSTFEPVRASFPQTAASRAYIRIEPNLSMPFYRCGAYDLLITTRPPLHQTWTFCHPSNANSTGVGTQLGVVYHPINEGTTLSLQATDGPPNQFGYIILGSTASPQGTPMGTNPLCIGGMVGRYNVAGTSMNSIGAFSSTGVWTSSLNPYLEPNYFLSPPFEPPIGFALPAVLPIQGTTIQAGQLWNFQLWHRDQGGTSGMSSGVSLMF